MGILIENKSIDNHYRQCDEKNFKQEYIKKEGREMGNRKNKPRIIWLITEK